MPEQSSIMIVGAGLAGSLLAVLLAREGFSVDLYERRGDPRVAGYAGGRSINLALSRRGLEALGAAGLAESVMAQDALPMRGRVLHAPSGAIAFQPYSARPEDAINSVSRSGLNLSLIRAAGEHANVRLHFDHACVDVDFGGADRAASAAFRRGDGQVVRASAALILSADGAFSAVRGAMQKTDRFEYSQSYLEHGYKELHIPPTRGPGGAPAFAIDPGGLHIWPRGGAMMIALPNRDGSFTCTLFWPFEGEHGLNALRTPSEIRAFFEKHYADAVPLMPTIVEDFQTNPSSSLVTVRCWPWVVGRAALLGDAAHAIVPFYGQGMNAAFEDCAALARLLKTHGARDGRLGDWAAALDAFQRERKPNAEAIADMALDNFVEMRDKVGSPAFLYRKRVEQTLHKLFPERCEPQYHLVSFSTVPYAEARRRGRELEAVYDAVVAAAPMGSERELGEERWLERVKTAGSAALAGTIAANIETSGDASENTGRLIDISPALTTDMAVWPGDTPLSREVICELAKDASVTLSTMRATVHLGAHADGPNHYGRAGRDVASQPLERYIGPCRVVEARARRGERVRANDVIGLDAIREERVLIKTGTYPDAKRFAEDFAALSVELVDALAARGVKAIGVDTPSVDLFASKALEAHNAILRHDIAILEGLVLAGVEPGVYELMAQPLKLVGFDASPVRAVLRALPVRPKL